MTLAMELRKFKEEGIAEGREKGIAEGIEKGIEKGVSKNNQFVIMNMVEMHMPLDTIAKIVGQSPQYVQQVIDGLPSSQPMNR